MSDERGAAAIVVAIVAVVLFGIGAVVVDAAALLQERRVLQNGADAAALAIAGMCGGGDCGDPDATAEHFADANAGDAHSDVEGLCGDGVTGAPACSDPPGLPAGASYVRVRTATSDADGGAEIPFFFARLLGFDGQAVVAQATVAWGAASSLTSGLPATISTCTYDEFIQQQGGLYEDTDDDGDWEDHGYSDQPVYIHGTSGSGRSGTDPGSCDSSSSGAEVPGGFGWLLPDADECEATSNTDDEFEGDPGADVPCDDSEIRALVGTVVYIPIFDGYDSGWYEMRGYAGFYVTGYFLGVGGGTSFRHDSTITGEKYCNPPDSCLYGFFVKAPPLNSGQIGAGEDLGVVVIDLVA